MEITLRKAAALQLSIQETLKGINLDATVTASIYEPSLENRILFGTELFETGMARREALLDALYDLRIRIGAANQSAGIDDRLAELARLEKDHHLYARLSQEACRETPEVIEARVQRMRTREEAPAPRYGVPQQPPETIQLNLFLQNRIDGFASELRRINRRRQKVKDELLELNIGTRISPNPNTIETLRKEELL